MHLLGLWASDLFPTSCRATKLILSLLPASGDSGRAAASDLGVVLYRNHWALGFFKDKTLFVDYRFLLGLRIVPGENVINAVTLRWFSTKNLVVRNSQPAFSVFSVSWRLCSHPLSRTFRSNLFIFTDENTIFQEPLLQSQPRLWELFKPYFFFIWTPHP